MKDHTLIQFLICKITLRWFGSKNEEPVETSIETKSENVTSEDYDKKSKIHLKVSTDNPADVPTGDFEIYAETIANLVKYSEPQFTVGIYGDWGTGKTTLMKRTRRLLGWDSQEEDPDFEYDRDKKIITVWFNAWRYEREEHFATIALMRTIAYTLGKHKEFEPISKSILSGLKIIGMDVLKKLATEHVMTEQGFDNLVNSFNKKTENLHSLDKDTIYFDGLNTIKRKIDEIRKDREYRIVVFIDDLDRCSPRRALEVLESVKVFLDIPGFVYILGLSIKTVAKLISADYSQSGIQGEDYIKKIVQIPIRIPPWNSKDIEVLIEDAIKNYPPAYRRLLQSTSGFIAEAIESNPRELKSFLNNLTVAINVLQLSNIPEDAEPEIFTEIITLEILKSRWNEFYVLLVNDERSFRTVLCDTLKEIGDPGFGFGKKMDDIYQLKDFDDAAKSDKDTIDKEYREKIGFIRDKLYSNKNSANFLDQLIDQPIELLNLLNKRIGIKKQEEITYTTMADIILKINDWEKYRRIASTGQIPEKEIQEASTPKEFTEDTKFDLSKAAMDRKEIAKKNLISMLRQNNPYRFRRSVWDYLLDEFGYDGVENIAYEYGMSSKEVDDFMKRVEERMTLKDESNFEKRQSYSNSRYKTDQN